MQEQDRLPAQHIIGEHFYGRSASRTFDTFAVRARSVQLLGRFLLNSGPVGPMIRHVWAGWTEFGTLLVNCFPDPDIWFGAIVAKLGQKNTIFGATSDKFSLEVTKGGSTSTKLGQNSAHFGIPLQTQ